MALLMNATMFVKAMMRSLTCLASTHVTRTFLSLYFMLRVIWSWRRRKMKKNRGNGVVVSGYVFTIRILRSSDMNQATKKAHESRTCEFWKLPTSSTFQILSFNCFLLEVSLVVNQMLWHSNFKNSLEL